MSSFSRTAALFVGIALSALPLAACSGLRPVYGPTGVAQERLALRYADPGSRLDQIIIQELGLRLGRGGGVDAPQVRISASSAARQLTRTGVVKAVTQYEMTVTASYVIVEAGGEELLSGTRRATAQYSTNGQVLADEAAADDARERAGRAVADTIRLSILSALAAPLREARGGR